MSPQQPDVHAKHGDHDCEDRTGTHGMLLFGEKVLYFSHLPMFNCMHQFMGIVEAEFDQATTELLAADREKGPEHIYTFVPEDFDITELNPFGPDPVRESLRGTVFRGHFERGGRPIARDVVAQLKVVHFRTLDLEAAHDNAATLRYLFFGRDEEFHVAHYLTARPDFDHILAVRLVPGSIQTDEGDQVSDDSVGRFDADAPASFPGRHDTPSDRLTANETVTAHFRGTPSRAGITNYAAQLEVTRDIYLEIGELA